MNRIPEQLEDMPNRFEALPRQNIYNDWPKRDMHQEIKRALDAQTEPQQIEVNFTTVEGRDVVAVTPRELGTGIERFLMATGTLPTNIEFKGRSYKAYTGTFTRNPFGITRNMKYNLVPLF